MTPWQTYRLRSTRIQLYPEIEVLPPPRSRWKSTAVNAASPLPNQQRLCRLSTLAPLERGAEPQLNQSRRWRVLRLSTSSSF